MPVLQASWSLRCGSVCHTHIKVLAAGCAILLTHVLLWCVACVWPEITRELRDLQLLQYIISHQALWDGPDEDDASGNSICYRRISRPEGRHSLEGLWKGSYGGHGLEIISVRLSSDGQMLLGTKVGWHLQSLSMHGPSQACQRC